MVEISLLILEITDHLLVTYRQNISDCSIREYRSIAATITGHQALSPGLNQWLSVLSHHIIKEGYLNYVDTYKWLFKKFLSKITPAS